MPRIFVHGESQTFDFVTVRDYGGTEPLTVPLGKGQSSRLPLDASAIKAMVELAEALVRLGAVKAFCRYDGGNDEGFAHLEKVVMADGSSVDGEELSLEERLIEEGADSWACALLGSGYGTGEYEMYGRFEVDLETGQVRDDPTVEPEES